jgi:hypothetical protein
MGGTLLVFPGSSGMRFYPGRKIAALTIWAVGALLSGFAAEKATSAAPVAAAAGRPPLLNDAFNAYLEHQGRWAYTETRSGIGRDGKRGGETIVRVDPSLPYAEQYQPIKLAGKSPNEKQLKGWADHGERAAKRRAEQRLKAPAGEKPGMRSAEEVTIMINGAKFTPDLDHAVVVKQDETSVTYEIPLRKEGGDAGDVFDQWELTARVNQQRRDFELATIRQRKAARVQVIARVADGVSEIHFSQPDPRYPSVPTKVISKFNVALFFGKYRPTSSEEVRTDFKHVTPYDERFGVKLGPMRTMEL